MKNKNSKNKIEEVKIGKEDSLIFACGQNKNLELSWKGFNNVNKPSGVNFPTEKNIVNLSSKGNHTGIITEDGELYLLGCNLNEKLGIEQEKRRNISKPTFYEKLKQFPIVQVVCEQFKTVCLLNNGTICFWGVSSTNNNPLFLDSLQKHVITKIGCGDHHSIALSDKGVLFSWGGGKGVKNKGQCGHGHLNNTKSPVPINFFKNKAILDFDCGSYHTIALTEEEGIFSWGGGFSGELGIGEVL